MKTKTPKVKRVHRGPISGQGPTLRAAKADLEMNLAVALEDSYTPAIIHHGEFTAIVYRTPTFGWTYELRDRDRPVLVEGVRDVGGCNMMGHCTRAQAIQQAAAHVVGLDGVDYHTCEEFPAFLTDPAKKANILTTRRFNRAYHWAKANKPEGRDTDPQWHEWAGWNMRDDRFA